MLRMSEYDFWHKCTPKKLKAVLAVHIEYKRGSSKSDPITAYIDEVM